MTPSAAIVADAPVSLPAALAGQRDPLAASLDIPDTASLLRRPDGDRREASQVTASPPPAPVAPMGVVPPVAPPPPITASPAPAPASFTSETPVSEPDPLPAVPAAQEQAPTSENASDSAVAAAVALSFPQELEAWRDARARTRGESPDDPVGPKPRVLPEPVDATTRPSPLAPTESADLLPTVPADLAPTVPAALTPTERPARRSTSRRRYSEDEDAALRRPAGAPLEAMAGSPVDFVLSEMGVWPGGVDEGGEGPAPDVPADDAPSFVAAAQRRAFWRSRPVRLALGLGALVRRYTGTKPFVYVLGRAFLGTVICVFAAGVLSQWSGHLLPGVGNELSLVARWLMAWGDGFVTGMLTAIFVAFKPEWLATWSDRLYLHDPKP